jgi:hypothetical protein
MSKRLEKLKEKMAKAKGVLADANVALKSEMVNYKIAHKAFEKIDKITDKLGTKAHNAEVKVKEINDRILFEKDAITKKKRVAEEKKKAAQEKKDRAASGPPVQ